MPETDKVFVGSIPENYPVDIRKLRPGYCPTSGCAFAEYRFRNRCWQRRGHASIGAKTFARR
jgi:hypothetical protein